MARLVHPTEKIKEKRTTFPLRDSRPVPVAARPDRRAVLLRSAGRSSEGLFDRSFKALR